MKNGVERPVSCISCRTISGEVQPTGGIIYNDAHWAVYPRSRLLLTPGQGFIRLKLRQAYQNDEVARVANMLREGFSQLER